MKIVRYTTEEPSFTNKAKHIYSERDPKDGKLYHYFII